jgi:hypothetical protein
VLAHGPFNRLARRRVSFTRSVAEVNFVCIVYRWRSQVAAVSLKY